VSGVYALSLRKANINGEVNINERGEGADESKRNDKDVT
jgi:hypothetical protein